MTRIYLHNQNIKDLSKEYDEIKSKLDDKEKRRRKKNKKHHKEKKEQ